MQIFNTINFVHAKGHLKKFKAKHLCTESTAALHKTLQKYQCFESGSTLILFSWIRICTENADPDPGVRKLTKLTIKPAFPNDLCFMTYYLHKVYF